MFVNYKGEDIYVMECSKEVLAEKKIVRVIKSNGNEFNIDDCGCWWIVVEE